MSVALLHIRGLQEKQVSMLQRFRDMNSCALVSVFLGGPVHEQASSWLRVGWLETAKCLLLFF